MSFNAYNNVVQTTPNSCGAFALAAALSHLNHAQLTNKLNAADVSQGFSVPDPQGFAQSIYQVTGNLFIDFVHGNATYRYQAPVADMNPPSALAFMAVLHGVDPNNININYNQVADLAFNSINVLNNGGAGNLLDTETAIINIPPVLGNIHGPVNYDALPGPGKAHLLLVNNKQHWIVINDQHVYDPATGYVGGYVVNDPLPLTTLTYNFNHITEVCNFSGLWIELS